jgi:hypothetical protein
MFASTQASAQSLVTNPNVDGTVVPWATALSASPNPVGVGTTAYNGTQDVDSSPTSGSVEVAVPSGSAVGTADAEVAAIECLAIPGGQQPVTQANYGTRLRVPSTNPTDGTVSASIEVTFFSDNACATPIDDAGEGQGRTLVAGVPDDAFWYTLADPAYTPATSLAAASVKVRLAVTKLADTGSAVTVQFDRIFVSLNGTTPVALQHFEVE